MKLSGFPNFPDLNSTTPPGAGAVPGAGIDLNVNAGSPAREPGLNDPSADFAAIFGGITGSVQGAPNRPGSAANVLPAANAMGVLPDAIREAQSFCLSGDKASECEIEPDSSARVITAPNGSRPSIRAKAERSTPHRDDLHLELPPGLTPDNPAWASLLATPAPFVAAQVPGCDLPPPADSDIAPLEEEPSTPTDPTPLFPGLPNNGTPAPSMPAPRADERGRTPGVEHRSGPDRSSSFPATREQRPTNFPRFATVDRNPAESREVTPSTEPTLETPLGQSSLVVSDTATLGHDGPDRGSTPESAMERAARPHVETLRASHRTATESVPSPFSDQTGGEPSAATRHFDAAGNNLSDTSSATPRSAVVPAPKVIRHPRPVGTVHAEKISGVSAGHRQDGTAHERMADKSPLSPIDATVMEHRTLVGTAGAKPAEPMSPASLPAHEASALTADAVLASAFDTGMMAEAESIESTARNTVETILAIADRVASADGQTVHLRFSIGENDLRVRVGYSGDEVRTTFHTESPELRAALLQEWQALNAPSADRATVRLADPVFASGGHSDQAESNSSFDSPSHQHREAAGRREQGFASTGFARPQISAPDSATLPSGASPRVMEPTRSTQRLHTFA